MLSINARKLPWQDVVYDQEEILSWSLPMVELFETIEGEGQGAGFPTVFVRLFHCNLRCVWCDTPYSYAPAKPEYEASLHELIEQVKEYASHNICLTGGEPLIHKHKSAALIHQLSVLDHIKDIHIETNGAIDLQPFVKTRSHCHSWQNKVRFIMDYKLPDSGEMESMLDSNIALLSQRDELKFVIGSDQDFSIATSIIKQFKPNATVLMSPVWEQMKPADLVRKILKEPLPQVKVSMQLHKLIWDPMQRGV